MALMRATRFSREPTIRIGSLTRLPATAANRRDHNRRKDAVFSTAERSMRGIKLRNAVTPNGTSLRNVVPWLRRPQRLTAALPRRSFERVKECLRASLLLIAVVSPSVCKAEHGRAVTPEIESLFNDRDSWASGDVTITGTHYSGERFSET